MTLEEIYAIPVDGHGWRLLPNGKRVNLGEHIRWSANDIDASIGSGASIGNYASIGSGASIGSDARIGSDASIGNYARIGSGASIGSDARIGSDASFLKSPIAVQGTKHLACQSAAGVISIGCQTHSFEYWTEHVLGIARQNGYSPEEGLEYQKIVAFIVANGIPANKKEVA